MTHTKVSPHRWYRFVTPFVKILPWPRALTACLLLTVMAWSVACGPSNTAVPCKSEDDCLGGQVCYKAECRDQCKSDGDCLGTDRCNPATGVCGRFTPGNENVANTDGGNFDSVPTDTTTTPQCGNQRVESGEQCDGTELAGQTCESQGFAGGTLGCSATCRFDTSNCQQTANCGNGAIDIGEDCDGTNLNGQNCQSRGFDSGTLKCSAGCRFDTSACNQAPTCGNGNLDSGEDCDGTNLNNQTCQSQGFASGTLRCSTGCRFDTSLCQQAPTCGNGKIDSGEECDGTDLNNQTCQSKGFSGGSLRCTNGCRLDTSACTQASKCGNGQIDTGEDCDGTNVGSKTCKTQGFDSGTLKCSAGCKLDTSGCQSASGKKKFGALCAASSECDSGVCLVRQGDNTGYCSAYCTGGKACPTSPAGAQCTFKIDSGDVCGWPCTPGSSQCPTGLNCVTLSSNSYCMGGKPTTPATCGNNKAESGEACDGTDLSNQTCQTRGFTSGTLKCNNCAFDTSGCTGPTGPANFGKACQSSNDCGSGLICVIFATNQSYCTANCSSSQPCPSNPPGASCSIQLQGGGNVCGWNTATGGPPICGNGIVDPGEDCDKTATRSTCKGLGYSGGTIQCSSACKYVTTSCTGTTKCPNLPESHCTSQCKSIVSFSPTTGPGYRVRHGVRLSWASRTNMISVKYAAASVNCVYPGTAWLGLGDMSMQNGGTPADTNGRLRHPQGTHVNGNDMDIGYFQTGQSDNDLRPVCTHTINGQDQYHCVQTPNILDATKSAFFIAKLLESNQVRVIGVDGKIGPLLKTAMQSLYNSGMISKMTLDLFNQGTVTWEETDKGRGWFRFHHHHLHVSYR